ncbi:S-adenosyl-L-methionine-dependent methyltransferase [Wolfiporia cocos MD-104 SS10]|uniref:S-adenosyl-L-methionine-dependent methyltransferase n=1 Tax=Wolfiporia cocos (strain MD-104) TaxID=742152 RepID=A0A2H3K6J0_WOLCO|nr:S-adenosyl-L-methionine-dependent methyltransferase [Wolfiporia cocos MD-104 SS10]
MSRKKRGAPRGKGNANPSAPEDTRTDVVERSDMHNERFEKYYKAQNILPDEEWEPFLETMRSPLPTTFRVAGSRQIARLLSDTIKNTHVPHLAGVVFEGEAVSPPSQISWYPEGLAWQFNVSKKVLRKSPEFKKFHSFLVYETEVGNISRQEAVSMLPPLFLEVEPHHRVIDMCAAPGSKTAQLLEALHAHDTLTSSSFPPGLLIANDSDHKRTHMLIHQAARLPSPALMVTNHDASIYPALKIPSEQLVFPPGTKARVAAKKQYQLLFDRILCDVPCSGDGTLRKNLGIWRHWQPMDGNGLHSLQVRILQRAMRMLKKGGRIVYSTCSLNPVENEAVVAAALRSIPGFELIDMSNHLPGLIHRPGIKTWRPTVDRSISTSFPTYAEYIQSLPEDQRADSKMLESHWPPPAEEAESLNLTRCMRIYPHLQDTGGFFIAVLQKVPPRRVAGQPKTSSAPESKRPADVVEALETSEVKKPKLAGEADAIVTLADDQAQDLEEVDDDIQEAAAEEPIAGVDTAAETQEAASSMTPAKFQQAQRKKGKNKSSDGGGTYFRENPYTFISPNDLILQKCIAQLNLTSTFPASNVLVRNPTGEPVRSLYLTNDIVKDIVLHNDYARMRLMTCGTKVVAKQEGADAKRMGAEPQFRVLGEGLPVVLPHIDPAAILEADVTTLRTFVESYYPLCESFKDPFKSVIQVKDSCSYIVRFQPGEAAGASLTHELVLPIWKSNVSVTLMIDKKAKSALSLRLFGEDITTAGREAAAKKQVQSGGGTPDESNVAVIPVSSLEEEATAA